MSAKEAAACSTFELLCELSVRRVQFMARIDGFDAMVGTPPDSPNGSLCFSGSDGTKLMEHIGATTIEIDTEALKAAANVQVPG